MENIRKKLNIKVVTLLIITIILALFAFFTNYSTLGIVLLLIATALPFFGIKKEIYTLTGSPVKHLTFYFESDKIHDLQRSINANFRDESPRVQFVTASNGRMDVSLTKDKKYAVVKLSRYVPHRYEPIGESVKFVDDQVTALCNYLQLK